MADAAEEKRREAEAALRAWARVHDRRDEVIRAAVAAGVPVLRVHEITRIARTTIMRIVKAA
jgi:hypothetical protein